MIAKFAIFLGWRTNYHVCAMYQGVYMDGTFTVTPWVNNSNFNELRAEAKRRFGSAIPDDANPTILSVTKIGATP